LGQGGSARGDVKHAGVKRFTLIGLAIFAVLACAACGGGSKHSAAPQGLPSRLVKQIKAEIRNPSSAIGGASSATTADVYGPASYATIDKAWEGSGHGAMSEGGRWYLIVLHGRFQWNGSVPPGAKQPHARIALEVWSPKSTTGQAVGFAKRVPTAVSRLQGHTVVDLS
jgi:hypothetical protein